MDSRQFLLVLSLRPRFIIIASWRISLALLDNEIRGILRSKKKAKIPVVLTIQEVSAVLSGKAKVARIA